MNLLSTVKAVAVTAATLGVMGGVGNVMASTLTPIQPMGRPASSTLLAATFGTAPVDESRLLVVAAPGSNVQPFRLLVVEQVADTPACWSIANPGSEPTEVNDLWNTFDFTGICRLQKDSNGYAVRLADEDVAGARFEVNERDGDLLLQFAPGTTSRDRITIGRTNGISSTGFAQIDLDPGWFLTKRTFEGQIVGSNLVYFTNNATLAELQAGEEVATGPSQPGQRPVPPTLAFNDIRGNRYAAEINRASELGTMSGYFEDGTFRPTNPLTREQAVSVVMETAELVLPASITSTLPSQVFGAPFPDVAQDRWSALKIAQAKELGIVTGDFETGNFRPNDNVSRAELMAMMSKVARLRVNTDSSASVPPNTPNPPTFTDINGHWAEAVIQEMAGYCGVATPLNETGTRFAPEQDALRDFSAAVSVRMVDCTAGGRTPL